MAEDKNLLDKIKDKARATAEGLKRQYGIGGNTGTPWPQTESSPLELYPGGNPKGFLPPIAIPINNPESKELKYGEYTYKDWRGYMLEPNNPNTNKEILTTSEKFKDNKSTYTYFNDSATDYFKHGLQILNNYTDLLSADIINDKADKNSKFILENIKPGSITPYEINDPVIFGFDIIIDVENSPLLNGAIDDFLSNYSNIGEVAARIPIYEDFKEQFSKFFKTNSTVSINYEETNITRVGNNPYTNTILTSSGAINPSLFLSEKKSYLSYYLNKIDGLDKLVEQNSPKTKKFLTDYNTDTIKLTFSEDVSLSLGTLSHLYKLLYWSKPNGKSIIPENLLRFNCSIIVSELRNYNRVIKALNNSELSVIKDNVSRYIYSLSDCQFYFPSMPHETAIDMGGSSSPSTYDKYNMEFDYKYSTLKFERFLPKDNSIGNYVGLDNAAMWKIIGNETVNNPEISTNNLNTLYQNGLTNPIMLKSYNKIEESEQLTEEVVSENDNQKESNRFFKTLKENAKKSTIEAKGRLEDIFIQSISREAQFQVNKATALLNRTLNKVISANFQKSMRPPRNIYTEGRFNPQDFKTLSGAGARIFYDVRGELFNFLGDAGGIIGNRNRSF